MQASRTIAAAPGVSGAMIAMATELNLDLIQDLGFERPAGAGPNDMVVAVAAADLAALEHALSLVATALTARAPGRDSDAGSGP
jgi:FdrA protein